MEQGINFNSVLIGVVGFLLAIFYNDVREGLKGLRSTSAALDLIKQGLANDKKEVDKEIARIREELDELCERLEKLEREDLIRNRTIPIGTHGMAQNPSG